MFDLEKSIAEWRRQMLAAGIKTPVPLEELESHLREEVERRMKLGTSEQQAFEVTVLRVGQACVLRSEFKKIESTSDRKIGVAAVFFGIVIVLRVLAKHHEMGNPWKNDQIGWLLVAAVLGFFGLGATIFNFGLGRNREIRFWKLAAIAYSFFAVWICIVPMIRLLAVPKFNAAFGMADRTFAFAAIAVTIISILGWRFGGRMLPVTHSWRTRIIIGIICCLLGPAFVPLYIGFIMPHFLDHSPAPLRFVLLAWMWTLMAVLGGVGYGLAEAADRQAEAS
jgi:MFS family permease